MINKIIRNIILFIVLVLFQEMVLNQLQFSVYFNPTIYVFFILILPFETPNWLLLVLAFVLGMSVDIFSNTLGLTILASVFIAFCRPGILSIISPRQEYEPGLQPTIRDLGFGWFLTYAGVLIFIHHTLLFFLEAFTFDHFAFTISKVLVSSLASLAFCVVLQFLVFKPKK